MPRVFISYSAKDTKLARRIARDLHANGIELWLAEEQVLPGDGIEQKISEAIRGSDYFIVLLSEHSVKSAWVQHEIAQALRKDTQAGTHRLIPVKVDDAPLPADIASILYIDLRSDYQASIQTLVEVLRKSPLDSGPNMADLVDTEGVAKEIGLDQKDFKGSGYLITTVLAVLTLVATGISAFSSYFQAFKNRPKAFFAVSQYQMPVPPRIDATKFYSVLQTNGIPKTTLQIDVINKGDTAAQLIEVGVGLPDSVLFTDSKPPANPSPVWVSMSVSNQVANGQNYVAYEFRRLAPDRLVSAIIGYVSASGDLPSVDVVCDGKNAKCVESISQADEWSTVSPWKHPLQVLGIGVLVTLLVGFAVVIKSNPKLRNAFLLVVKEMNPTLARIFDVIINTTARLSALDNL